MLHITFKPVMVMIRIILWSSAKAINFINAKPIKKAPVIGCFTFMSVNPNLIEARHSDKE